MKFVTNKHTQVVINVEIDEEGDVKVTANSIPIAWIFNYGVVKLYKLTDTQEEQLKSLGFQIENGSVALRD